MKGDIFMYYINSKPDAHFNYSTPTDQPFNDCLSLPDDLLTPYIEAHGFVNLSLDGNTVTAVETNQEALNAYLEEYPDNPVEPIPTDHEILMTLLGVTE